MKRYILTLIIAAVVLGTGICTTGFADEEVRMETSAFDSLRRPAALFDHDTHNEAAGVEDDCGTCHHVWENGKLVEDESSEDSACADCHSIEAGPDNPVSLANAYHTQCRTCHADQGKGPLLCGQCHKKEAGDKGGE